MNPTDQEKAEARALLNAAKDGAPVMPWRIARALEILGDMTTDPTDTWPDQRHRPIGTWERQRAALMQPASWFDPIH